MKRFLMFLIFFAAPRAEWIEAAGRVLTLEDFKPNFALEDWIKLDQGSADSETLKPSVTFYGKSKGSKKCYKFSGEQKKLWIALLEDGWDMAFFKDNACSVPLTLKDFILLPYKNHLLSKKEKRNLPDQTRELLDLIEDTLETEGMIQALNIPLKDARDRAIDGLIFK